MLVTGIEYQITWLGLIPRDGGTVGVLHVSSAAVAYDVLSISDIIKYPIDESTAIGAGGGVACGGDFPERTPAVIPADGQGFYSDR